MGHRTVASRAERYARARESQDSGVMRRVAPHKRMSSEREILAVVAHDLKNPLNAISLGVGYLLREAPSGDEGPTHRRAQLELIAHAVARVNRIVEDLVDLSSIDATHLHVHAIACDVGNIVAQAVEEMRSPCNEKRVELLIELAAPLPEVVADCGRLVQVFSNLIGNALRFTPGGGRITVGAKPTEGAVVLFVRDTGEGIATEDIPHVFAPFWSSRRQGKGLGLGLTIAQGIVRAHGGEMAIESHLASGTCVSFTVPRA